MKIKLLKPHANLPAGREWNCPWASTARKLIESGVAVALEGADLHLNPDGVAGVAAVVAGTAPAAATPAAPKRARVKAAKAAKPK